MSMTVAASFNQNNMNPTAAITLTALFSIASVICIACCIYHRCKVVNENSNQQQLQQLQQQQQQQGLDSDSLGRLPVLRYSSIKLSKKEKAGPKCPICWLQFKDNEQVLLLPDCGHFFHATCMHLWLESHATCPICRRSLGQHAAAARALSAVLSSFRRDPDSPIAMGEGRRSDATPGTGDNEPDASRSHDHGQVVSTLSRHSQSFEVDVDPGENAIQIGSSPVPPPLLDKSDSETSAHTAPETFSRSISFRGGNPETPESHQAASFFMRSFKWLVGGSRCT